MPESHLKRATETLAASVGMVVFAALSHRGLPWIVFGVGGLLAAAAAIEQSFRSADSPASLLGLCGPSRRALLFTAAGCAVGAGLGLLYRTRMGMRPLPVGGLTMFVALACVVGATEELVYRGWMQGRLRVFGWPAAVMGAAVAHAAYKTALFVWPPELMNLPLVVLATWTAAGGIVFGLLREFSGSVVPPMLAHAVFDFLVYGAVARAPWWVWT